jgi:hypothetical protein
MQQRLGLRRPSGMMPVELRESFVQIRSAIRIQILSLNPFATVAQWNDLTVLSHSFDRCPTPLVRGSPIGGNIVGVRNPEEFSQVSIQPSKLFHSSLD